MKKIVTPLRKQSEDMQPEYDFDYAKAKPNRGGFEISLFLLVTGYFVSKRESRVVRLAEMSTLAIMAIMTGVSHWIISARMLALRAAMQTPGLDNEARLLLGESGPRNAAENVDDASESAWPHLGESSTSTPES